MLWIIGLIFGIVVLILLLGRVFWFVLFSCIILSYAYFICKKKYDKFKLRKKRADKKGLKKKYKHKSMIKKNEKQKNATMQESLRINEIIQKRIIDFYARQQVHCRLIPIKGIQDPLSTQVAKYIITHKNVLLNDIIIKFNITNTRAITIVNLLKNMGLVRIYNPNEVDVIQTLIDDVESFESCLWDFYSYDTIKRYLKKYFKGDDNCSVIDYFKYFHRASIEEKATYYLDLNKEEIINHIIKSELDLPNICKEYIDDALLRDAAFAVIRSQQGSTSMLQRKFNIGYNEAGYIMKELENQGVVGAYNGTKPRDVLIQDIDSYYDLNESYTSAKNWNKINIKDFMKDASAVERFRALYKEEIDSKKQMALTWIRERQENEKRILIEDEKEKQKMRILQKQKEREIHRIALEELRAEGVIADVRKREPIPQEVQDAVWRRDGGRCVKCGSQENLEFDHIIPFSKGGSNTVRNLQLLCEKCNREKSNNIG